MVKKMKCNEKGQIHGWNEVYWNGGQLMFKGNYVNGRLDGLFVVDNYEKIKFYL
jgi:hypothetical protein